MISFFENCLIPDKRKTDPVFLQKIKIKLKI